MFRRSIVLSGNEFVYIPSSPRDNFYAVIHDVTILVEQGEIRNFELTFLLLLSALRRFYRIHTSFYTDILE